MPQSQSLAELARQTGQRTQMGSPFYNNKSLEEAEAGHKLGVTILPPELAPENQWRADQWGEQSVDQQLLNAKAALARADSFEKSRDADAAIGFGPADESTIPALEHLGAKAQDDSSVFDSTATKLARLGKQSIGTAATVGSFVPHPAINIPSQVILGIMGAKRLAEASPEEIVGNPIGTGMELVGIGAGLHGLSSLGSLGRAASKAATSVGNPGMVEDVVNTAKGYRGQGMSRAQAGQGAGWPLGVSEEISGYRPQAHELPPYRDGTFNIANPFEGGFNKPPVRGGDPNFSGGMGDPELAGSTNYPHTSGTNSISVSKSRPYTSDDYLMDLAYEQAKGASADPAYMDHLRQMALETGTDAEVARLLAKNPASSLAKLSMKKPRPKGR